MGVPLVIIHLNRILRDSPFEKNAFWGTIWGTNSVYFSRKITHIFVTFPLLGWTTSWSNHMSSVQNRSSIHTGLFRTGFPFLDDYNPQYIKGSIIPNHQHWANHHIISYNHHWPLSTTVNPKLKKWTDPVWAVLTCFQHSDASQAWSHSCLGVNRRHRCPVDLISLSKWGCCQRAAGSKG